MHAFKFESIGFNPYPRVMDSGHYKVVRYLVNSAGLENNKPEKNNANAHQRVDQPPKIVLILMCFLFALWFTLSALRPK